MHFTPKGTGFNSVNCAVDHDNDFLRYYYFLPALLRHPFAREDSPEGSIRGGTPSFPENQDQQRFSP